MQRKQILVIEDDPKTRETIRRYLEHEQFEPLLAPDGAAGLRLARDENPALIVLDLMLPEVDGLTICRLLRRESNVPVVMVTARTTEDDRLRGLDLGADDYISKPFSPRELIARIRAVLRRAAGEGPAERVYRDGALQIDVTARRVLRNECEVKLTPTEFRILTLLTDSAGRTLSRAAIVERALGEESDASDRTVDVHIRNLRKKLEDDADRPFIATVFGTGYRFDP